MRNNWKYTKDELPKEGKYVLVHLIDEDEEDDTYSVAKIKIGISEEERDRLLDEDEDDERGNLYCGEDEDGNNEAPYIWLTPGADDYFGQDVDRWLEIPELN